MKIPVTEGKVKLNIKYIIIMCTSFDVWPHFYTGKRLKSINNYNFAILSLHLEIPIIARKTIKSIARKEACVATV